MAIHVVTAGDTIQSIAQTYGASPFRIIRDNDILNPDRLTQGQALLVLVPEKVHTVQSGDTLASIAESYDIPIDTLLQYNPALITSIFLYPEQTIILSYEGEKLGSFLVNGYAYPFIDPILLEKTVPYLSFLSVFSYGFEPDGTLRPIEDDALLAAARKGNAAAILVLTPSDENGLFSNTLASQMLNNPAARQNLIENLLLVMEEKGYYGVDIDFEYVFSQDTAVFRDFIRETAQRLQPLGYKVFVALAPKIAADQPGLLYESHDYPALTAYADFALLMTYEWGYAYGPPMAVAPIHKVTQVLDYAIQEIPLYKILMGIPNYGYDWTLPFVAGQSRAPSLGNTEAVHLAVQNQVPILFDETAQSPYFFYRDEEGYRHEVWFEDARSIDAKLHLAASYPFAGVGYWNLMRPFTQNWMLLATLYNIIKFPAQ